MTRSKRKAAFLDRDGVINIKAPEPDYVTRWEQLHFFPDAASAIALLNEAGFQVIIVTNQRCVAKGLLTTEALESLHWRMCQELAKSGAKIDAIYYCPHEEEPPCPCRKPSPAMLLTAARAHDLDLAGSWMIGDSEKDIQAGKNAGCKTARILRNDTCDRNADVATDSLLRAVERILELEGIGVTITSRVRPRVAADGIR